MKTKNIFKTLAFAILMPAMLLTTACGKETVNDENTDGKGFALPVTVNATRGGDDATKATYNESTGKLSFSTGDILYVSGWDEGDGGGGRFCGALNYVPATGKFSGTIYVQNEWPGTADELFAAAYADSSPYAARITATLLPNGYADYGYLAISDRSTDYLYDDYVITNSNYTLATSKGNGVEQLSLEQTTVYDGSFALAPQNAVLSFTITGLEANTDVDVLVRCRTFSSYIGTKTIKSDGDGKVTFVACYPWGNNLQDCIVTVDDLPVTLVNSKKNVEKGKIYNITRVKPDGVIWKFSEMSGPVNLSTGYTHEGVTLQGSGSMDLASGEISVFGDLTFTAPTGKVFKKIVINEEYGIADIMGDGWSENTWTGSSATASFDFAMTDGITSIIFLLGNS